MWKTDALIKPLLEVRNKPGIWDKSKMVPFPRKGELRYAKQYIGISLTITASKMYNKMLLLRILSHKQPNVRNKRDGLALAG